MLSASLNKKCLSLSLRGNYVSLMHRWQIRNVNLPAYIHPIAIVITSTTSCADTFIVVAGRTSRNGLCSLQLSRIDVCNGILRIAFSKNTSDINLIENGRELMQM